MVNLQVRNIPEALHERLRRRARVNNSTMSAFVLTAVERELDRCEWQESLAERPRTDPGVPAVRLLAAERSARYMEME